MLAIILLVVGVVSRLIAHAPNFTPVIALALFGGVYLKKQQAVWMPLALMAASDIVLGLHGLIFVTWGSLWAVSMLGRWQRENRQMTHMLAMSVVSAVSFFVVTNLGAWAMMYPHTLDGLLECYVMAIPFFRNSLVSTVVYSGVLFGAYELLAHKVKNTQWAWIAA